MKVTIKEIKTVKELSERLKGVCQIKKVQEKQVLLTYNENDFIVKRNERSENEFNVSLAIPKGLYALGVALGVILAYITGGDKLVSLFLFILVLLLIVITIYRLANKTKLDGFVTLLQRTCKSSKEELLKSPKEESLKSSKEALYPKMGFAIPRENYKLILIGLGIIVLGFILMVGGGSKDPNVFKEDELFSFRRISLSSILVIFGFMFEVYAIMKKPKSDKPEK
jgi:hypothetical protein